MNGSVFPSMESLESRRLLSATLVASGLCLIPPPAHAPAPVPPTPAPVHHHRHRSHAAAATPGPLGDWAGIHVTNDSVDASLQVHVSQAKNGELFAKVAFTGSTSFSGSAQLTYNRTTGQYAMWIMSPKLVVKFSGTLTTDSRGTPEFHGSLESYTRKGAFKAQLILQKAASPAQPA